MDETLGNMVQSLALGEEETPEIVLPAEVMLVRPSRFYVVGELLTHRPVRVEALVNLFRTLWIPGKDQADRSLFQASSLEGSGRLLFSFKREADRNWVLRGAPWEFEKCLFVVVATDGMEDPRSVRLNFCPFWIRIRGLPPVTLELDKREDTGRCIGSAIGKFLKTGRASPKGRQEDFLRIRVEIDIEVPLRRRISFRVQGEACGRFYELEYEHLPFFCLFCGLLSHTGLRCPRKEAGDIIEPVFSVCLNAERKERWLREQREEQRRSTQDLRSGAGTRFGLHARVKTGWIMAAPDLPESGFVRSRSDFENVIGPREEEEGVATVSEDGRRLGMKGDGHLAKRQRGVSRKKFDSPVPGYGGEIQGGEMVYFRKVDHVDDTINEMDFMDSQDHDQARDPRVFNPIPDLSRNEGVGL